MTSKRTPQARRSRARIDPELRRQLGTAATAAGEPVQAILRLRPGRGAQLPPPPRRTRDLAEQLVTRVAEELGTQAGEYDFNVFPNLGYFVLSAPSPFVLRVLDQPEIASASANRRRD